MISVSKAVAYFDVTLFRAGFFDGSCCKTCCGSNCLNLGATFMMLFNK